MTFPFNRFQDNEVVGVAVADRGAHGAAADATSAHAQRARARYRQQKRQALPVLRHTVRDGR